MSDMKLDMRVERRLKRRSVANRSGKQNHPCVHIVIDLEEDEDKEIIRVVEEPEMPKRSDCYTNPGGHDGAGNVVTNGDGVGEDYKDSGYKKFLQSLKQHGHSYTLSVCCGSGETKVLRYEIDDWVPGADEDLVANWKSREKRTSREVSGGEMEGLRALRKRGSETSVVEPVVPQMKSSAAREASVGEEHDDWSVEEEYVRFLDSDFGECDDRCQEDLDDDNEREYEKQLSPIDDMTGGNSDPGPSSVGNRSVGRECNQGTSDDAPTAKQTGFCAGREAWVPDGLIENVRHEWSDDEEYVRFLDSSLPSEHVQTGGKSNPGPSSDGNNSVGPCRNNQGNETNDVEDENCDDFVDLDDGPGSESDDANDNSSESDDLCKDYMAYLDRLDKEDEDMFDDESEDSETGSDVDVIEKDPRMDEGSTPFVPTHPSNTQNSRESDLDKLMEGKGTLDEFEGSETDSDVVVIEEGSHMDADSTPFVPTRPSDVIDVETYCPTRDSTSSRAQFKAELLGVLNKPYDSKEHQELRNEVEIRKPIHVDRNLRGKLKVYESKDKIGKSYLDQHSDFAKQLDNAKTDNHKSLNLLRGFFFWLKNVSRYGAFKPWNDLSILEVSPQK